MTLAMMQECGGTEGTSDEDPIEALRQEMASYVRLLEATREWLAEVEESHTALERRVAVHHSAFAVGALEPPTEP